MAPTKKTKTKQTKSIETEEVKKTPTFTGVPTTMEELLASTGYTLKGYKKGDTVEGKVTKVTAKEVLVDIGGKAEGVVMDRELELFKDLLMALAIGDDVVAQIVVPENDRGQAVLSLRKFVTERRWNFLTDHQKNGEPIEVIVREPVRGGLLVEYGGIRGYIPNSQIDGGFQKQMDKMNGRKVQVKVIEVDKEGNRLVFSQRAISEAEAFAKQKDLLEEIDEGSTVQATITTVVPFGAFAKFTVKKDSKEEQVEGLIHISEIAWEKVEDASSYIKAGDSLKVKVTGIEKNTGKVNLSIKQLLPDPWEHVLDMFEKDTQVSGVVSKVTPIGIFVTLSPGVEGLIHISKLAPGEEPKEGDDIACIIENVEPEKRKISLSMALHEKPIMYR
jgi:ribosomal protein S1